MSKETGNVDLQEMSNSLRFSLVNIRDSDS